MEDKSATYQRLQSIIVEDGCPICHLSLQAVHTFLDTILWESSTDLNVHEMLTESLGFCGRHSRELLLFGGQRLAVAVVERASLLAAIRRLSELVESAIAPSPSQFRLWQTRHTTKVQPGVHPDLPCGVKPCPACVRQTNEEARGIEVLLAHLEEFSTPLLAAGGLCLPHFFQAARAASEVERETLTTIQKDAWTALSGNLEEFIQKHMHHRHAEPISEEARHAVEHTITGLTGEYPVR
jgi:hypothetical protein